MLIRSDFAYAWLNLRIATAGERNPAAGDGIRSKLTDRTVN